jgi:hypothetical protein
LVDKLAFREEWFDEAFPISLSYGARSSGRKVLAEANEFV